MSFDSCGDEVRAQLERILASKEFSQAPSLSKFLRFVVEQTLDGKADGLKELTLGVEVFGLSTDDSTVKTSVVRVSASRVRKKLSAYYATLGCDDRWIITLAEEGYAPQIAARAASRSEAQVPDSPRRLAFFSGKQWKTFAAVCAAAVILATASRLAWGYWNRMPVVVAFKQLTNTGHNKDGPLLTDGSRLYFRERTDGPPVMVSTSVDGGTVAPLEIPSIQSPLLLDYQNGGHRFLVYDNALPPKGAHWEWTPGQPPRLLDARGLAEWTPDFVYLEGTPLRLNPNRHAPAKRFTAAGIPEFPRWSPSHQLLRFTVGNPPDDKYSLWEMRGREEIPQPLRDYPPNAHFGTWSPDGKLFVFEADRKTPETGDDIWGVNEHGLGFPGIRPKPVRLTDGPLDFGFPVPSVDGQAIFAIGTVQRMEILRYDAVAGD